MISKRTVTLLFLAGAVVLVTFTTALAITLGQMDDFEDATVQGWTNGGPTPMNVATGGPLGAGDNYLENSSVGGGGTASRMAFFNFTTWTGDYLSAGVGSISMQVNNFTSASPLNLRIYVQDCGTTPCGTGVGRFDCGFISTTPVMLASGSGWTPVTFSLAEADLTEVNDFGGTCDYNSVLSNVDRLWILHNDTDSPSYSSLPIVATLGVDNISADAPLPVELIDFQARVQQDEVLLSWRTGTEENNAGFEVQTETDDLWETLGFVNGAGTTMEERSYDYRVSDRGPGTHRFRLKQVDFDGTFEYSPIVEATVEVPGTYHLTSAYPNPFNPATQFTLTVAQTQDVQIEVVNVMGQRVALLHEGPLQSNDPQTFRFEAQGLPSGSYYVQIAGETFNTVRSLTLLK